jgi:hypothetical protein
VTSVVLFRGVEPVLIAMSAVTIHLTDVAGAMQPQIPRHRE